MLHGEDAPATEPPEYWRAEGTRSLVESDGIVNQLITQYVNAPASKLPRMVRLAGCFLKSQVYNMVAAHADDPPGVWRRPVFDLFDEAESFVSGLQARAFYDRIGDWRETVKQPGALREMFAMAVRDLIRMHEDGLAIRARG